MHGNVAEWTLDTFAPYKPGVQIDPVNFENEVGQDVHINEKVTRGGSYQKFNPRLKHGEKVEDKLDEFYHFRALRSASRIGIPYDFDLNMTVGFRVVLAPEMDVPIPEAANK
jgi:formylglycine-generating enzyme required for sulfatase activity